MKHHKPIVFSHDVINQTTNGVISIIIGCVAILLNIIEIIVLGRKGRNRKQPENFILSLSFADLLVGATYIITGLFRISPNSINPAKARLKIILYFSIVTSILHVSFITVERLYAVLRPLKYRVILTTKRTRMNIAIVWIFSISIMTFWAILPHVIKLKPKHRSGFFQGIIIFITGGAMLIVYGFLGRYLAIVRKRTVRVSPAQNNSRKLSVKENTRDTMFYTCIAIAFILCSSTAGIGWLLPRRVELVNLIGQYLLVLNSSINPILYFWRSHFSRKDQRSRQPVTTVKGPWDARKDIRRNSFQRSDSLMIREVPS